MSNLQKTQDDLQRDSLKRLTELMVTLDRLKGVVGSNTGYLNNLGEIQGQANMLDCRLASLATVRILLQEAGD